LGLAVAARAQKASFVNGTLEELDDRGTPTGCRWNGPVTFEKLGRGGGICAVHDGSATNQTYLWLTIKDVEPHKNYRVSFFRLCPGAVGRSTHGDLFGSTLLVDANAQPDLWEEWSTTVNSGNTRGTAELHVGTWHHQGKICFDDFKIVLVEVTPRTPEEGSTVTTAVPRLSWEPIGDSSYAIQLSRDPSFPETSTRVISPVLDQDSYQLIEPLENGDWYWRMACAVGQIVDPRTADYSACRRFTVNATHDTVAPGCVNLAVQIKRKGALRLAAQATDWGGSGIDTSNVSVEVNGDAVKHSAELKGETLTIDVKKARLTADYNTATVRLVDKAGNSSQAVVEFGRKPMGSVVTTNEKHQMVVNGKPVFVIGLYAVMEERPETKTTYMTPQNLAANEALFQELREAGFNTIQNYGTADASAPAEVIASYYGMAARHGLQVIGEIPDIGGSADAIKRYICRFGSSGSIIAWNLVDEGDMKGWSPVQAMRAANAIRAVDPKRMVGMALRNAQPYLPVLDMVAPDPYTISGENAQFALVEAMTGYQQLIATSERAVLVPILQGLSYEKLFKTGNWPAVVAEPSYELERCIGYIGIIHGAQGIMYYAYHSSSGSMKLTPAHWEEMKRIAAEWRDRTPIFLSDTVESAAEVANDKIPHLAKSYRGKTYLFLVNPDNQPSATDITFHKTPEAIVNMEAGTGMTPEKTLHIAFKPFEVVTLELH
jgi:hypothetical protein